VGNPIDDLEQQRALEEMGIGGSRIFRGARSEGATRNEAFFVAAAWFYALLISGNNQEPDEQPD